MFLPSVHVKFPWSPIAIPSSVLLVLGKIEFFHEIPLSLEYIIFSVERRLTLSCVKEISLYDIYRSIIPFVIVMCFGLAIVMIFPEIATWLPDYVSRR